MDYAKIAELRTRAPRCRSVDAAWELVAEYVAARNVLAPAWWGGEHLWYFIDGSLGLDFPTSIYNAMRKQLHEHLFADQKCGAYANSTRLGETDEVPLSKEREDAGWDIPSRHLFALLLSLEAEDEKITPFHVDSDD